MPGIIHPHCLNQCQKLAKTGGACVGACELNTYLQGQMYGVDLPIPAAVSVNPPPATIVVIDQPKPRINVRSKGQRGEREVVKILQDVVDLVRARYGAEPLVLQRNALQSHLGGCDLHGLDGFAVEVKFVEVEAVGQWWAQAIRQAEKLSQKDRTEVIPILFYRASRRPWAVKFRAFVMTPRDRDAIHLDVETDLQDFLDWFENAYDEVMVEWSQTLS